MGREADRAADQQPQRRQQQLEMEQRQREKLAQSKQRKREEEEKRQLSDAVGRAQVVSEVWEQRLRAARHASTSSLFVLKWHAKLS